MAMNHTSVESGDLPDYFHTKYQWTKSVHVSPAPAKGRKCILNAVSSEAPDYFQLKHMVSLTPDRRRAALSNGTAQARDCRLMQDLNCHSVRDFRRFMYYDLRSRTDLNSIPLGKGVDLLEDRNAGARVKLPFYVAHADAVHQGRFKVHQGIFTHAASQRLVRRTDNLLMLSLKRVKDRELPEHLKLKTAPVRKCLTRTSSCDLAFSGSRSPFSTKSLHHVLKVPRKTESQRPPSPSSINVHDELKAFDYKLKSIDFSKPVTKISLGLV